MSRNVIDAVGLGKWLVGFLGLASFTTMYLYLRKRLQRKRLSLFCHLDIQLLNRGAKLSRDAISGFKETLDDVPAVAISDDADSNFG